MRGRDANGKPEESVMKLRGLKLEQSVNIDYCCLPLCNSSLTVMTLKSRKRGNQNNKLGQFFTEIEFLFLSKPQNAYFSSNNLVTRPTHNRRPARRSGARRGRLRHRGDFTERDVTAV